MNCDLTFASYNCKFFDVMSQDKVEFMQDVFSKCTFLCIQEHWLYESQFHRFDTLSSGNVEYIAASAMDSNVMRCGRPILRDCVLLKLICLQILRCCFLVCICPQTSGMMALM